MDNVGSLHFIELSTIRIRSLIAEALSLYLLDNPDCKNRLDLIKVIYQSSDTTKQIAEWSRENIEETIRIDALINDLNSATLIIKNHETELKTSEINTPFLSDIEALKYLIQYLAGVKK